MAGDAPVVKQKVIKKVLLPTLTNAERNAQCLYNYALPFILLIYLGVVLKRYSLEEYKHLVPSEYLFGESRCIGVDCWGVGAVDAMVVHCRTEASWGAGAEP